MLTTGSLAAGQESVPETTPPPAQTEDIETQRLDDLIPQSAAENPDDWAAGRSDDGPEEDLAEPESIKVELDASYELGNPFDIEGALNELGIAEPEKLTADPDLPSFADIDSPTLVDLPDLAEFDLSDQLVLAFPAEAGRFPEEAEFIARFRALSAIEALGSEEDTVPQLAARARTDADLLNAMLRNYGYYNGEVIRQLSGGRRGFSDEAESNGEPAVDRDPKVRFDVLPGPRYTFGAVDLGILDALPESERAPLLEAFGISSGDPIYADRIVSGGSRLRFALGQNGYPFGEVGAPDLLIDHSREEGDLTLPVDPGGRFVFGDVTSDDPEFLSGRHLGRIARFDAGDLYQTGMQADLRRAILATGLVSSVAITPRAVTPPEGEEPGEVALDVEIERAPLRTISGAIGFGTQDGFKLEGAWEHRNLFPPEGALRLRGIIGTREQLASVTFRRSNFRARDQILTFDAFASAIETEAVDARTVALRGSFERVSNLLFQKPLSWQLGAEVLYTDERNRVTDGVELPRQEFLIGGLFGRATLDGSDDLLDPRSGYRLTLFAEPEVSRTLGEVSTYLRARADASYYQPLGNIVFAARFAVATVVGADLDDIAPSRRLYSGGGGSVRGFAFQAIGPRNEFDEPEGGRSLLEAAVEARIPTGLFDGAIEVVPFFDLGSISSEARPDFDVVRVGAGVGARYKTSFGPIRVDVGVPVNPTEFDAPVVVYVSLGQAF
ncbi:autotransporter assembly complex family protein [uncultured Erythrobacter sp.]|uniref:autotransporter assembly complex protein TamA n=1 Tax=uncultured Erythrobacter sp. TaxID=263913 RepID=UPI00260323C2|nr:BamA/TamA family outer membrane protein [uncultured Erythrobacter sp.]